MTIQETKRKARIVNQMLSMHSALRDRYALRAKSLTIGILGCSVILCTITFLPDDVLQAIHLSPLAGRVIMGVFSSFVFFLSIVELRVAWKEVSSRHGSAADRLAKIKHQYRAAISSGSVETDTCAKLTEEYDQVMEEIPPIPDKQFAPLKAYHLRKVRLSQMLDAHVGCPVWVLRLYLIWEGIFGRKDQEGQNQ